LALALASICLSSPESSHSLRAKTPGLTRTSVFSGLSFLKRAARRAPIVTSGLLPTCDRRFFSSAYSVISW